MQNTENNALEILSLLKLTYPDSVCTLDYESDKVYQLLFSTRLAAQCTDARVNIVAKDLYREFPTLQSFADADINDLERIVRPCGLYHVKARDIKACAKMLIEDYNGIVPEKMEDLLKLPGIGRKIANIIIGDVYHQPAVVTDTHCIRLANRMGLADSKDPYKVEIALSKIIPPEEQSSFCHRLVDHGRAICKAINPACDICPLTEICPKIGVKK